LCRYTAAIDELVRVKVDLVEYSVNAVVEGIESLAQTRVSIRPNASSNVPGAMMKAGLVETPVDGRQYSIVRVTNQTPGSDTQNTS
jgi:hypothetical protein